MTLNDMSANILHSTNNKKDVAEASDLTTSEQELVKEIRSASSAGGLVNVISDAKGDLTALAWKLVWESDDWQYFAWLPTADTVDSDYVLVNNVAATRSASRRLREILTFDGATCVVALTERGLPEATITISVGQYE